MNSALRIERSINPRRDYDWGYVFSEIELGMSLREAKDCINIWIMVRKSLKDCDRI